MHKDFVETQDNGLVAFCVFLGYRVVRCSAGWNGPSTFGLLVPQFDWEQVQREWNDPNTTIRNPKEFMRSVHITNGLVRKAKNSGGLFTEMM